MDPIVSKTGARVVTGNLEAGTKAAGRKQGARFEEVRQKLETAQTAQTPSLPPPCQVTPAQKKTLEAQLRKNLDASRTQAPQEMFRVEMKAAKTGIDKARRQAAALPKGPGGDSLRDRLQMIEAQFQKSGADLEKIGTAANPRELLKLQVQMYQMTQNIEVVTKVIEQVNSGVKQILQTQV